MQSSSSSHESHHECETEWRGVVDSHGVDEYRFWWYLLVQLTLLLWTLQINLDAFHLPIALTIGRLAILLGCLLPTLASTLFVASLLVYHSYLVSQFSPVSLHLIGNSNQHLVLHMLLVADYQVLFAGMTDVVWGKMACQSYPAYSSNWRLRLNFPNFIS